MRFRELFKLLLSAQATRHIVTIRERQGSQRPYRTLWTKHPLHSGPDSGGYGQGLHRLPVELGQRCKLCPAFISSLYKGPGVIFDRTT